MTDLLELTETITSEDLGYLMEESHTLSQVEIDQVRALYELSELLEIQVNCQLVAERVRPGYLYQAAGTPRSEIERRLVVVNIFPQLTVTELPDDEQQFLITSVALSHVTRYQLGGLLGYWENYEGPFDQELGKFVSYELLYQLKYIDDIVVKRIRVELFGYFVRNEQLHNPRFWRYLHGQHRLMLEFSQRYEYQITLYIDGEEMLLSEVNRQMKLYTKFPGPRI